MAVLATEATARSERLATLIREHAAGVEVTVEPCPGWATRVEALDIADQARREGVRDLRSSGLLKVRAGVTTLEEVITVTNE